MIAASYIPNITNCYWDMTTSLQSTSPGGGTGKTTTQMKDQTNFLFSGSTSIWGINASKNNGYPYLKGQYVSPIATAATNLASNGFTANWGAVDDATSYSIIVTDSLCKQITGSPFTIAAPATSLAITGLSASTGYIFKVKGVNAYGSSVYSNVISLNTNVATFSEINIKQDTANIASGTGTFDFGNTNLASNSGAITFTIENTGIDSLTLSGLPKIAVSGLNASDFTVNETLTTSTVVAGDSTIFTITFTPGAAGVRSANISIANNDANENPYNFTITGIGVIPPPSAIAATSITSSGFTANWETVSCATSYLLEVSADSFATQITASPFTITAPLVTKTITNIAEGTTYKYRVKAVNAGSSSIYSNIIDVITNMNSAPTDIVLSVNNINENVAANSAVGTLISTDIDATNTFTYTLVSGAGSTDNAFFNISGDTLRITNSPDFETKSSYSIRVRTTDQGNLNFEKAFTITINDLNEAPTDIVLSANTINENVAANSTVGTLSSTDQDAANTFAFTLVSGVGSTDNSFFNIIGDTLHIANSPDFETNSSYSIRLRTTDQGNLTFEKVFVITINDLNEVPSDIVLSANTINENIAANSTIGTLSSTDQDAANTFTYALVSGTGSADNAFFNISGDTLRITNSPDFEIKSNYSIRLRTTDQGNLTFEKAFTISINDLNEAPSDIVLSANAINENVAANSTVGTLSSTDQDAANAFTYALVSGTGGTDNAFFNISGDSLRIINSPDFETKSSYSIRILTSDQGNLTFEKAFTITIIDIPELPTVTTQAINVITATSATANGNITTINAPNTINRGVIYYDYDNTDKIISDAGVTNVNEAGNFSAGVFTSSLSSLSVNNRYNARAYATTVNGTGYGERVSFLTLANIPLAPTVDGATANSLDVAINVNSNPIATAFAIYETNTSKFVQADGSLAVNAVWQTATQWHIDVSNTRITVNGLTIGATYTFKVKARNADNVETVYGGTTSGITCSNPSSGGTISGMQTICFNTSASEITNITLPSGQTGTLEYQWQSSTDGINFSNLSTGTYSSITYNPGSLTLTTWYKRLARVSCMNDWTGAAESNVMQIVVRPNFTSGSIATTGETLYYDGNPVIISSTTDASGGNGVISYQWQRSTTSPTIGFVDISGATNSTYNQDTITLTTWYRRMAKDGLCNTTFTLSNGVWKDSVVNAPSVIVRNNMNIGYGSLRNAIANVNAGGTVTFDLGVNGQTITLTTGTLNINKNITLNNSNLTNGITISGSGNNITINAGKVLTLSSGSKLTVIGAINNTAKGPSGLVIASGASFIHNTVDLQATVQRNLTNVWHLFGSPFKKNTGAMLANITGTTQMMPYTNGTGWGTNTTSPITFFVPTVGYAIKPSATVTASFTGNLYYSAIPADYTTSLIYNGTSATQSWNLVANPYTASIDWNLLGKTNLSSTLYYWDNAYKPNVTPIATASYMRTYNSCNGVGVPAGTNSYIAPLQGFFVKAVYTSPKLSFTPSARVHKPITYYKDASNTEILVRLKTETEEGSDELVICKNDKSKLDFEQFDSEKLFNDSPVEIYSQSASGEKLVINTINTDNTIIPLGIKGNTGKKVKITAFALETAEQVYLEDRFKGKLISLTENTAYEFELPTENLIGRFFIRFGNTNAVLTTSDVKVFENDNELNIIAQTGENLQTVEVYSLTGACVFKTEGNSNVFTTKLQLAPAIYMVRVKTSIATQNVKVSWK